MKRSVAILAQAKNRAYNGGAIGGLRRAPSARLKGLSLAFCCAPNPMGWGYRGQWRREWNCKVCSCKGIPYSLSRCKKCHTPWWEATQEDISAHPWGKWANGMPSWMKRPKDPKEPKVEGTTSTNAQIMAIQESLEKLQESLGEEESEATRELQEKLETLKTQTAKETDQDKRKELESLKKEQKKIQSAIENMKEISGCEAALQQMETRLEEVETVIRQKEKKPAQERLRSLQDKKNYRKMAMMELSKEIEAAEKGLRELQEKEKEHSKELEKINSDMREARKELSTEDSEEEVPEDPPKLETKKDGIKTPPEKDGDGMDLDSEPPKAPGSQVVVDTNLEKDKKEEDNPPMGSVAPLAGQESGAIAGKEDKTKKGRKGPY